VVADDHLGRYPAAAFEQHFGRPVATHRVASWFVLIYRTNLLQQLENYPSQLVPARASPPSYFELKTRANWIFRFVEQSIPFGRICEPEEVAALVTSSPRRWPASSTAHTYP
jgi:hypothetical protein